MAGHNGQVLNYIRVSSADQATDRQHELLGEADRVFEEKVSGKNREERPELTELIAYSRESDVVRVASMDRLARSLSDLLAIVTELTGKGVTVEFVHEKLSFTPGASDPYAEFQLHVLGAVAQLERNLIRRRQRDGIDLAKAKGVYKGRAKALKPEQVAEARGRIDAGVPKAKVARDLGVSRQTLYSSLGSIPSSSTA